MMVQTPFLSPKQRRRFRSRDVPKGEADRETMQDQSQEVNDNKSKREKSNRS